MTITTGVELKPLVMPEHKSLEHASTVVVTTDDSELWYVLKWAERQGKHVAKWMYDHVFNSDNTVFCISTAGDMVGWTDQMDRSLYYKPFDEFLGDMTTLFVGITNLNH